MIILAIDPGPVLSGWMLYEDGKVLAHGVEENVALVDALVYGGPGSGRRADVLAIEMIQSYGMAVGREVFETCVWIGRFQQAWRDPAAVRRVPRLDVKLHLCRSARAKDTNVWQALLDRFGPVGTKKKPGLLFGVRSHSRAALALAVTVADQSR